MGDNSLGYLWTQTTLVADNPSFRYRDNSVNPNPQGQCIGTYKFPPQFNRPYTQTQRQVHANWNMIGVAFPSAVDVDRGLVLPYEWTGAVIIESIQKENPDFPGVIVRVQPFYSWNPLSFTTPVGYGTRAEVAYKNAWEPFDRWVDQYWDGDIQRSVSPYANFWHNNKDWPKGWQSEVLIYNATGQTITYWIENHLAGGGHGHVGDACTDYNECEIEINITLANGQSGSRDPFRFHVSNDVQVGHDTCIFIRMSTVLGGTSPNVHIFPNASGSVLCPSVNPGNPCQ